MEDKDLEIATLVKKMGVMGVIKGRRMRGRGGMGRGMLIAVPSKHGVKDLRTCLKMT